MWSKKDKSEASITSGEQAIANKETEGLSQSQIVIRRFIRHKAAMTSVFVLMFLIIAVFTALETKIGSIRIPGGGSLDMTSFSIFVQKVAQKESLDVQLLTSFHQ